MRTFLSPFESEDELRRSSSSSQNIDETWKREWEIAVRGTAGPFSGCDMEIDIAGNSGISEQEADRCRLGGTTLAHQVTEDSKGENESSSPTHHKFKLPLKKPIGLLQKFSGKSSPPKEQESGESTRKEDMTRKSVERRGESPERKERIEYPIFFYQKDEPYYSFTNFSPHSVTYKNRRYPTAEHLFQSFKFMEHRPLLAEHIRTVSESPSAAFAEARRFQPEARSDWLEVNLAKMDEVLFLKFTQHNGLRRELMKTGNAVLIEDSPKDAFWGIGEDREGRNELGKALMRLREKLRDR